MSDNDNNDNNENNNNWANTNRAVSNRVASKGPLYPSKTTIIIFCVVWYDPVYMPLNTAHAQVGGEALLGAKGPGGF